MSSLSVFMHSAKMGQQILMSFCRTK